jgi:hypothetical protein
MRAPMPTIRYSLALRSEAFPKVSNDYGGERLFSSIIATVSNSLTETCKLWFLSTSHLRLERQE